MTIIPLPGIHYKAPHGSALAPDALDFKPSDVLALVIFCWFGYCYAVLLWWAIVG